LGWKWDRWAEKEDGFFKAPVLLIEFKDFLLLCNISINDIDFPKIIFSSTYYSESCFITYFKNKKIKISMNFADKSTPSFPF
jgi:hypothetical protein